MNRINKHLVPLLAAAPHTQLNNSTITLTDANSSTTTKTTQTVPATSPPPPPPPARHEQSKTLQYYDNEQPRTHDDDVARANANRHDAAPAQPKATPRPPNNKQQRRNANNAPTRPHTSAKPTAPRQQTKRLFFFFTGSVRYCLPNKRASTLAS